MMRMQVIGKRIVRFTSKEGKNIDGSTVFLGYEDNNVEGMVAEKFFISSAKLPSSAFGVGDILDVAFTRYGKIDKISLISEDDIDVELD